MQLGFVSAILPKYRARKYNPVPAQSGFDCVEMMCSPKGKAERRYTGVTHMDVDGFE